MGRMSSKGLPSSLGLVGTGRVAAAIGAAAQAAGVPIAWVTGRNPDHVAALAASLDADSAPWTDLPPAGLVVISVTDGALDAVATELAGGIGVPGTVVHTCGARGRDALAALAKAGWTVGAWHPMQAFATTRTPLAPGIIFGITAEPDLAERLAALTTALQCVPLTLADEQRARYHAAAVLAANYAGVLMYHSAGLLADCGLDRPEALAALTTLVRTCLDGIETFGLPDGLTGPAVRGDADTIRRHLDAIADDPTASELYRACGLAALPILAERGLPDAAIADVRAAVDTSAFAHPGHNGRRATSTPRRARPRPRDHGAG